MRIDMWSDVVCPWCYLGFVRLDKAIAQFEAETGETVELFHHAYQLDRNAGTTPVSAVKTLGEKYGIPDEGVHDMMQRVTDIAATEGLSYRLPETLHGNTLLAHRLLIAAAEVGLGHSLMTRLFNAYFEKAEAVFSASDLRPHALAVGMDAELVDRVLASDEYQDVVEYDFQVAEQIGVRGVPFFVFNQKLAVPGADETEVLLSAMREAQTAQ